MIPNKLNNWTIEIIETLIEKNIGESDKHDFKRKMPGVKTLTKICCAFANTKGGFIVLGVKEVGKRWELEGIENDKELAHDFGQRLKANPTVEFSLPKIILIPGSHKVVAVFEIPQSPERPHVPEISSNKRLFQKRTNKGNDYMTYEEIKLSFSDFQNRIEKLKLLYIELLSNIEQLDSMKIKDSSKENVHSLVSLDNSMLNSLLSELYILISKNTELIRILFTVREKTKIVNNKIKIFFSQVALPLSNSTQLTKEHNEFINSQVDALKPLILNAISILEEEFDMENPIK